MLGLKPLCTQLSDILQLPSIAQRFTAIQYYFTVFQYSTAVQYYSTAVKYSTALQNSTVVQYSTAVQHYCTVVQYSPVHLLVASMKAWRKSDGISLNGPRYAAQSLVAARKVGRQVKVYHWVAGKLET